MANNKIELPLVSVIIPCYNQGQYLSTAIESVQKQTYETVEIIVIDDGSTDNTREIAGRYEDVIYFYQPNQGLSASRNKGVEVSKGAYLVFLDADDWLYPDGISINLRYLKEQPEAAFVSGSHRKVFIEENYCEEIKRQVSSEYYWNMLQGNYIAMIAAVMYQRWVFDEFKYDVSLKACEDYDLFLKVTRKHTVIHHIEMIAAYRRHSENMSGNIPIMLSYVLQVLKRQRTMLKNKQEKWAYRNGQEVWKTYFCDEISQKLQTGLIQPSKTVLFTLIKYKPRLFFRVMLTRYFSADGRRT